MHLSFSYPKSFDPKKLVAIAQKLTAYTEKLYQLSSLYDYSFPECSLYLPHDKEILAAVHAMYTKTCSNQLKYIVVIGIGGSNLGTKAVYEALYRSLDHLVPNRLPKMFFADTCDAKYLTELKDFLLQNVTKAEEVLLVMISKSGGTTETIVNFEILYAALQTNHPNLAQRVVVITDLESPLWVRAEQLQFHLLLMPKLVGGRFSVFSSVGLFPLLAAGIDIEQLLQGAQTLLKECFQASATNLALHSAAMMFYGYQKGFTIHDTFLFQPELESLGKWYRQLLGESIGKEKNKAGDIVHIGITPTVSIGSTDLHSVAQLYLGGPKNKVTTFVSSEDNDMSMILPPQRHFSDLVTLKSGISIQTIMQAILEGTKIAYTKAELPYMHCILSPVSSYSLGEFMQWKMLEIMYLGELFNINAFDQPNVEMYKIETRKLLQE